MINVSIGEVIWEVTTMMHPTYRLMTESIWDDFIHRRQGKTYPEDDHVMIEFKSGGIVEFKFDDWYTVSPDHYGKDFRAWYRTGDIDSIQCRSDWYKIGQAEKIRLKGIHDKDKTSMISIANEYDIFYHYDQYRGESIRLNTPSGSYSYEFNEKGLRAMKERIIEDVKRRSHLYD